MSTDVIGSRYRLGSVVTCTPEATTWDARDTWLDERVLVVTPEPGCDERFAASAGAMLERSSDHLLGLYDIGGAAGHFVVFGAPSATLSDERAPREEEDVLVAGRALGDALETLHERGIVHGDLHPGAVVVADSGATVLSPWPLAPRPQNWGGPGGFGADPDETREIAARDDVRALGAILLGALAGPPLLSSEQVGNVQRELADRAPNAVTIADRALTPPGAGGYAVAAELRDDCTAALEGRAVAASVAHPVPVGIAPSAAVAEAEASESRRAVMVLAATGAALFAGFGIAGSLGADPQGGVRPVAAAAPGCVTGPVAPDCTRADRAGAPVTPALPAAVSSTAVPPAAAPARLVDHGAGASGAPGPSAPNTVSSAPPATSSVPARAVAPSTTTTGPPATTTSSPPSTSTTSTSTPETTTTTAPPTTTTSTSSPGATVAGPDGGNGPVPGPAGGPAAGPGH